MGKNYSAHASLTFWEKVEFCLLYSFVYLLSLLPFCVLYLLSDLTYLLVYKVRAYRLKVVRKNLACSFPEKSEEELREIEKRFYHFFCDLIFETVKVASISKKELQKRMVFRGVEHIDNALTNGQNVAVYLAHFCNWEWVTSVRLQIQHDDMYIGQVYHVLQSKVMDKLMLRLRSRMDTVNIPQHELLRRVVEQKKKGKNMVIGFISDQAPEIHTINFWTDFLNQDTAIITGTETVAKKYGFACLFVNITRPKRGYYEADISVMSQDPSELPNFEVTERYARALEANIRQQPEMWLWSHNRWKRSRQFWMDFLATHKNNKGE